VQQLKTRGDNRESERYFLANYANSRFIAKRSRLLFKHAVINRVVQRSLNAPKPLKQQGQVSKIAPSRLFSWKYHNNRPSEGRLTFPFAFLTLIKR